MTSVPTGQKLLDKNGLGGLTSVESGSSRTWMRLQVHNGCETERKLASGTVFDVGGKRSISVLATANPS